MKLHLPGKYFMAGFLLIVTAAVFIIIAFATNRGDITSAAVVISGMFCAVAGIFILTFSGGEPIDPWLVAILPTQDLINVCRIASDLGITGNTYFLPNHITGESRVMLFNPVASYQGGRVPAGDSFSLSGSKGLVTVPPSDPFIRDFQKQNTLPKTDNKDEITRLLRETISGRYEFTSHISTRWEENAVLVTFHDYRFIDGCQVIARESPRCCILHPCVTCSLCGSLISGAMDTVVSLDRCSADVSSQNVTAVFTLLKRPDRHP